MKLCVSLCDVTDATRLANTKNISAFLYMKKKTHLATHITHFIVQTALILCVMRARALRTVFAKKSFRPSRKKWRK